MPFNIRKKQKNKFDWAIGWTGIVKDIYRERPFSEGRGGVEEGNRN